MVSLRRTPWWAWATITAVLVIAATIAAGWYIVRAYAPLLARERVETALTAALERPVRVGRVSLVPWFGRVELEAVSVAAAADWQGGTMAHLERASATVGIASLWRGELVISTIVLDGVNVQYVLRDEGEPFALPPVIPDRFAIGPLTVAVNGIHVRRGQLSLRHADGVHGLAAANVDIRATPSEGGVKAMLSTDSLALSAEDIRETLSALTGSVRLRGDELHIERLDARWRDEAVSVSGDVRDLDGDTALAVRASAPVPLRWLGDRLKLAWSVDGLARAEGTVTGPLAAPAVIARVRIPALTVEQVHAQRVAGSLAWDQRMLRVSDVTAEAFGGTVAGALAWSPDRPAESRVDLRLSRIALDAVERLAKLSLGLKGDVSAAGELRGDLRHPEDLSGRVSLSEARVTLPGELAKLGTGTVRAELRVARAGAEILEAQARWPLLRAERLTGRVDAGGAEHVKGIVTADVGRIAALFGTTTLEGEAATTIDAGGAWPSLAVTGRTTAARFRAGDVRVTNVDVRFTARERTLRIADAAATLGSSRTTAAGVLQMPPGVPISGAAVRERLEFAGTIRTEQARLEDFAAWIPSDWNARGPVNVAARLEGTLAAWRAQGAASGARLVVRGEHIETLDARFDADQRGMEIDRLSARLRDIPVRARVTWTWAGDGTVRGEAGPASLAGLPGVPDAAGLAGTAVLHAEAQRRNARWTASAVLEARDVQAAGLTLGPGTANIGLKDDIATADATFPDARLTAHATTRLPDIRTVDARLAFVDLALAPFLARAPAMPEALGPVRGTVTGSADLSIPTAAPRRTQGTVRLTAVHLTAAGESWRNPEPLVIRREPALTRIERLRLESPAGALQLSGTAADDGRLDLGAEARIALAPLATLRAEIRDAGGVLDANVKLRGTLTAPEPSGRATLRDGRLVLRDVEHPITGITADVALAGRRVRISDGHASILGNTIDVAGDVTLDQPSPTLDLTAQGAIPLALVAAFRPEIREAHGVIDARLRVAGTMARPRATGDATVRADHLLLRDYPEPLREIRARVVASASRVAVTEAVATVGGGSVRGSGSITLRDFAPGPYAFSVQGRRITFEPMADAVTTWDADLELVGTGTRSEVRGEARMLRGTWVSETPLLRQLLERRAAAVPASETGLNLAIRIVLGDNFVIRTAVVRLRPTGTLELRGTPGAPVLFGTVQAEEGQLIFRKHRFTLTRAAARFVDPRGIDPVLDVQGTAQISSYEVRLTVTGRTDNLEVRLASTPALPEEDVLSLIAFGATREQLGKAGGTVVLGEVAGLIVQDLFGIGAGEGLGPLDVFEMKTTGSSGPVLELGKRVNERARVTYSQGIENTADRRLRVEYEVVGPLVVAGEQDFRGGFGGDVLLRVRFR
jgi:autotransporter translocation and assembly factor TamB